MCDNSKKCLSKDTSACAWHQMWKLSNIMIKDQFMSVWKGLALEGPWGRLVLVFASLYVLVLADILLLCLVVSSASPHLSLSSYSVRNSCPKLVQSCNHSSPRLNYALVNVSSTTVPSWKLISSFHIFAPKYYKCPPWKFISVCLLNPYFTKVSCFLSEIVFACGFFGPPPPLNRSKALKAAYGIRCF